MATPSPLPARPLPPVEPWQQQLAGAFTDIDSLCAYLRLSPALLPVAAAAERLFPLKVPLSFARRMAPGDPGDPLLRQVLPVADELVPRPGFSLDPVGDLAAAKGKGLLHKYHGRVLLLNTGSCAVHCRYCFRRNFPYADMQLGKQAEQAALDYIGADASIAEVILSGGDPLLLSDTRLAALLGQLAEFPHVKRVRVHSRLPVVLPARVTPGLLKALAGGGKAVVVVIHCNHANELDEEVLAACRLLNGTGFTVLNQAVLLAGVNASVKALRELSERLFAFGVLPYYLHLLDLAQGVGHFEVPQTTALALYQELLAVLPGYLVPKLVREEAGAAAKRPVV